MKIEIISEEVNEEIFLSKRTLLLGDNYFLKKQIIKNLDKYFNKKTSKISIMYDGIPLDKGQYDCIVIPSINAIEHELKLGSNSTLKNIFEKVFEYEKAHCIEYNAINDLIRTIFYESTLSKLFDGHINCDIGEFNSKYLLDMLVMETSSENFPYSKVYKFYINYINILSQITSKNLIVIYDDFGSSLTYSEQKEVFNLICSQNNVMNIFSFSSNNFYELEWLESINIISNHSICIDDSMDLVGKLQNMDSTIVNIQKENVVEFINNTILHFNEYDIHYFYLMNKHHKELTSLLHNYFGLDVVIK